MDRWLEAAEAADAQEDKLHGASRRGDEMPGWIADKQKRLAKIREAREALEAEAAAAAAAKAEAERAAEEKRKAENRKRSGPVPRPRSKEIPWGRIATGALAECGCLTHPPWRRPCELQLTDPKLRPLSGPILVRFSCRWN